MCRGLIDFGSMPLLFAVESIHIPICSNAMISALVTPRNISGILLWLVGGGRGGSGKDCHHSLFLQGSLLGSFFLLIPKFPLVVPLLRRVGFLNHDPLTDAHISQLISNALHAVEDGSSGGNDHPLNL